MEFQSGESSRAQLILTTKSQGIDINKILDAIKRSNETTHPFKAQNDKDIIIFQGFSGTGKSSTILTFSGEKMIGYDHPIDKVHILMSKNVEGKQGVKIEGGIVAGTIDPASLQLSDSSGSVLMWDMPGSGENRGIDQAVINGYFYTRVFEVQRYIKLALLISHSDLTASQKGCQLQKKFQDFIRMFGDVQPFYESMLLIITKCPKLYSGKDSIKRFQEIIKLDFVQKNEKIKPLIKLLAIGKIKIIIMKRPQLPPSEAQITIDKAIDVTSQYKDVIKQFSSAVKSLKKSTSIKLHNPLSQTIIKKSPQFIQAANFSEYVKKLKDDIRAYLMTFDSNFEKKFQTVDQINQIANNLSAMKNFAAQFKELIDRNFSLNNTEQADTFLSNLNELLIKYAISVCNDKQIKCPSLINIKNSLIIISFLNALNYDKYYKLKYKIQPQDSIEETQLNIIAATNVIVENLRRLNIQQVWKQTSVKIKGKISNQVTLSFEKHLNLWQGFKIYQSWKKNFKFFPAFSCTLSKFMDAKAVDPQYAKKYFQQIQKKERKLSIQSGQLKKISKILQHYQAKLNIKLDPTLIDNTIARMLHDKEKELIEAVIDYNKMEKSQAELALQQYIKQQHHQNTANSLTEENNKLKQKLQLSLNQTEINKQYKKLQEENNKQKLNFQQKLNTVTSQRNSFRNKLDEKTKDHNNDLIQFQKQRQKFQKERNGFQVRLFQKQNQFNQQLKYAENAYMESREADKLQHKNNLESMRLQTEKELRAKFCSFCCLSCCQKCSYCFF